jgi:CheY-like chemotaxis protein
MERYCEMDENNSLYMLLAEDNRINQRVASILLKQMGVQFDIASNGIEAVELVKKKKYDVILMDIHMPVMDGLEATRQIRAYEIENKITLPNYIIALSASEVLENRRVCTDAGMDEFMEKPMKEPILREMISRVFV